MRASGTEAANDKLQGFILTRQWGEQEAGQELVFWIASPQGPVRVQLTHQESVFFIAHADLDRVKAILGNQLPWRSVKLNLKNLWGWARGCGRVLFPQPKNPELGACQDSRG